MAHRLGVGIVGFVAVAMAAGLAAFVVSGDRPPAAPVTRGFPPPEVWPSVVWRQVDDGALAGPGWDGVQGVATGGPGIVAWGESSVPDAAGEDAIRPVGAIWTSVDGGRWDKRPTRLVNGDDVWPSIVAIGPDGFLATATRGDERAENVLVQSADGERWLEVAGPPGLTATADLVGTDAGFALLGSAADRWAVWVSADGRLWQEVSLPHVQGDLELHDLVAAPDALWVAGRLRVHDDWDAIVWRGGGQGFVATPRDPILAGPERGTTIGRLLPFAGGLFATGGSGKIPECQIIGMRVASVVPRTGDHCEGLPPAAFLSADGRTWAEVDGPQPVGRRPGEPTWIDALAAGGAGIMAIVNEAPLGAERASVGLWTSANGVAWGRIGDGMDLRKAYLSADIVSLPGRVLAFGGLHDGDDVAVWIGTPG